MSRLLFGLFIALWVPSFLQGGVGIELAEDYLKNSALQWEWALDSLNRFDFDEEDQVLDVGCGDGKITALISSKVPRGLVVGLDISKQMIEKASSQFKEANLAFTQGDAIDIPFKNQFDKLVSFLALHWVLDQNQALLSMKEALKENGKMLLVIPGKAENNLASLSEKLAQSEKWAKFFPFFNKQRVYFTVAEYKELLSLAGLQIQSIQESESWTVFKDKDELIAWIKPLVNFIDHLETENQEQFIDDIASEMLLNNPPKNGVISIKHRKIEVIALK
ncbi:class I SAM-dependent methyltransferase [Criblamydia sequanensis]|uniref:Methyltransferase n=1 Tax=Candidatus Criblamydia sequanensis CRIB-18 TaxID=1437425 RepID=A0A090D275_9BACT|nr:class I SAM-dependent methyltransferase [Criblamydia sequanensis]CDR34113.1 Methyltransferase [Criblamydia sequanensis CRIB-18]